MIPSSAVLFCLFLATKATFVLGREHSKIGVRGSKFIDDTAPIKNSNGESKVLIPNEQTTVSERDENSADAFHLRAFENKTFHWDKRTMVGPLRNRSMQEDESLEGGSLEGIMCTLMQNVEQFSDEESEENYMCELFPEYAGGIFGIIVPMEGFDLNLVSELNMVVGLTSFVVVGGRVQDDTLIIPSSSSIRAIQDSDVVSNALSQAEASQNGMKVVLIVRVTTADSRPSYSSRQIANSVFGSLVGGSDTLTLASQYDACSYGKLNFRPATGDNINNGVYELRLSTNANGQDRGSVERSVVRSINRASYDHVMIVLPPGSLGRREGGWTSSWVAYAYRPGTVSVFNDDEILSVSNQMHEIGHNLGLHHSGEGDLEYGDTSGMMGYGHQNENTYMCFNAAKSFQLGWYADRQLDLDPTKTVFDGKLIGVTDYGVSSTSHTVVLRIRRNGAEDWFMTYNRREGINSSTKKFGNQVTLVRGDPGEKSNFIAAFSSGQERRYRNFDSGRTLTIRVTGTGNDGDVNYARVFIQLDGVVVNPNPPRGGACGCDSCTDSVLNKYAGDYAVGSRIDWVVSNFGVDEEEACSRVCGDEFPGVCGAQCDPDRCNSYPDTAGVVELRSEAFPQYCLDVKYANTDNLNEVWLYECNGTPAQQWFMDTDTGFIRSALDENMCVVPIGDGAQGSGIVIYECGSYTYMSWTHENDGTLRSREDNNKCIDIVNDDAGDGDPSGSGIHMWECNGSQDKVFRAVSPNLVEFRSEAYPGYCLDVKNGDHENGSVVWLYRCNGTPAQHWRIDGATGFIRSALDENMCMVPFGDASQGSDVVIWECGSFTYMPWTIENDGTIRLRADNTKCVDIHDSDAQDGDPNESSVQIFTCNGTPDKTFQVAAVAAAAAATVASNTDAAFMFRSASNNLCLDVPDSDTANGQNLIMWECTGNSNQLWTMDSNGYIHSHLDNSKCIDPEGPSTSNGAPLQLWDCGRSYAPQQWTWNPDGELRSRWNTNACIDANGNGEVAHMWSCDGGLDQIWTP